LIYDFVTSNVLLPLGGLFICLFVGWVWGYDQVAQALSNEGQLQNQRLTRLFFGLVKFVTPLLVLVVLLQGLKIIQL
jgi:NSS family neurotransmitter:Na+ symporter